MYSTLIGVQKPINKPFQPSGIILAAKEWDDSIVVDMSQTGHGCNDGNPRLQDQIYQMIP
jgi:hypothetical protein